jgi:hypothetical protein
MNEMDSVFPGKSDETEVKYSKNDILTSLSLCDNDFVKGFKKKKKRGEIVCVFFFFFEKMSERKEILCYL